MMQRIAARAATIAWLPRAVPTKPSAAEVRYDERFEERVEGYRVTYVCNGITQTTQLPYDPGDRIRVRVDVHPEG